MKSHRWIALVLGAGILSALAPSWGFAQGTSGSTGGSTNLASGSGLGGSIGTAGSSGGGASSQSVSAAVGSGLVNSVTTISASAGTPSATSIPSTANVLGSYYVNYYSLGLPSNYAGKFGAQNVTPNIVGTMGKYIYVTAPSTTTTSSTTPTQGIGFTTFGQPRAPVYSTSLASGFHAPKMSVAQVQANAREAISGSTMLANKNNIKVDTNGTVVLLNGTVASETERAVAEGMVRMTPGVSNVVNNLVVTPSKE